jgi:hypothetical protein
MPFIFSMHANMCARGTYHVSGEIHMTLDQNRGLISLTRRNSDTLELRASGVLTTTQKTPPKCRFRK